MGHGPHGRPGFGMPLLLLLGMNVFLACGRFIKYDHDPQLVYFGRWHIPRLLRVCVRLRHLALLFGSLLDWSIRRLDGPPDT